MFKAVFLTIIVGVTVIWTAQAKTHANELECTDHVENELREYVKLDSWQQLFSRHYKFILNDNGDVINEFKRLKFNTIIHNALFGCNHERDDEVDDCPNIYHGSIKSCHQGTHLRSAMFRTARCAFTESSVKHLVLSDSLLNSFPANKLREVYESVDRPIRDFGETIDDMLSILAHGETGGIGDLMALNLYLNNIFETVLIHKVPVEPIVSLDDFEIAKKHSRNVHNMILEKLYTFWDTWCSDTDIVTQYRFKYVNQPFERTLEELNKNIDDANEFIHSLNVSDVVDLDFDPDRILLTDFVGGLVLDKSMPDELLNELQLKSFEASFEFNPKVLYNTYHKSVFANIHTVFFWTTITHLKLGVQFIDEIERFEVQNFDVRFATSFVKLVRPLFVFHMNQVEFVTPLTPKASININNLLVFLTNMVDDLKSAESKNEVFLIARPDIQKYVRLLSADMKTMLNMEVPSFYYDSLSYDAVLALMKSNYQAFSRLVSATCGSFDDRKNINKMKKFFYFLSEAIPFKEN